MILTGLVVRNTQTIEFTAPVLISGLSTMTVQNRAGIKNGVLTNLAAIQPADGMQFGPRHLDFHPTQPWVYVSIESQTKLYVYKRDPATGLSREPIFVKETLSDPKSPFRQETRQNKDMPSPHPGLEPSVKGARRIW